MYEADPWDHYVSLAKRCVALRAERDTLAKDAERYLWLRDRWFVEGGLFPWKGLDLHHDGFPPVSHFDEAIDDAMQQEPQP